MSVSTLFDGAVITVNDVGLNSTRGSIVCIDAVRPK